GGRACPLRPLAGPSQASPVSGSLGNTPHARNAAWKGWARPRRRKAGSLAPCGGSAPTPPDLAPNGCFLDSENSSRLRCVKKPEKSGRHARSSPEKRSRIPEPLVFSRILRGCNPGVACDRRFLRRFFIYPCCHIHFYSINTTVSC